MGKRLIIPGANFDESNSMSFYNSLNIKANNNMSSSYVTDPSSVSFSNGTLTITGGTETSFIGNGELKKVSTLNNFNRIVFGNITSESPITEIEIHFTDDTNRVFEYMFYVSNSRSDSSKLYFKNLKKVTIDGKCYNRYGLDSMFENLTNLEYLDISGLDCSGVNSLSSTFRHCESIEEIDLKNFKPVNFNSANNTFDGCHKLKKITFAEDLDMSHSVNLFRMFYNLRELEELDIHQFSFLGSINHTAMFQDCPKLKTLNMMNFPGDSSATNLFLYDYSLETVYCSASNYQNILGQLRRDLPTVTIQGVIYTCTWTYSDGVIRRTLS